MELMEIKGDSADRAIAFTNLRNRWRQLEAARTRNDAARLEALRAAREKGISLRHIAQATGLSHQRVHQLLSD